MNRVTHPSLSLSLSNSNTMFMSEQIFSEWIVFFSCVLTSSSMDQTFPQVSHMLLASEPFPRCATALGNNDSSNNNNNSDSSKWSIAFEQSCNSRQLCDQTDKARTTTTSWITGLLKCSGPLAAVVAFSRPFLLQSLASVALWQSKTAMTNLQFGTR